MNVENTILQAKRAGKKLLAVLIDPENLSGDRLVAFAKKIAVDGPDLVLIGGSTYYQSTSSAILALKNHIGAIPVLLFPGHPAQFSADADALLYLSLISGNNPDTLIGQQIASAREIRRSGIETISMGYIMVDGGNQPTTARVTNTTPIPVEQLDRIVDTAIAGEMLGLHTIYLEAGSGAAQPAGQQIVRAVRQHIDCPLLVGGGIHTPQQMCEAFDAGADIVVIGNYLETHPEKLAEFCKNRPIRECLNS
ncbi:MAG: geranylgeranylglyceryl/heptaprenylglyceryl phosphate synthase [Paludibacteraceae bacterium]|nr:geranylgeranylglyceryl/heptaprenylglyceryl phosphate synthase [Paludibacteraceae bacterium]